MHKATIQAADLFCGAGGTTTGLLQACAARGRTADVLAINHWNIAIDTHTRNHPALRHLCESLDNVDPRKVIPGGKLDILCASPECTHHSIARGGKPCSDQSRSTAWHICRWAEALRIDSILIENVREFRNWGPLNKKGKPLLRKKGKTYRAFLEALRSLDYTVEDRILNAADYGDATTRQRLFIIARRSGSAITWPAPSHAGRWRAAREIIDWTIPSQSLADRKRPLSANTMRRITAGLMKFGGKAFLMKYHGDHEGREDSARRVHSVEAPLATLDCSNRFGLVEPFVIGQQSCAAARGVSDPLPTIATSGAIALCEAFLVNLRGTTDRQLDNTALPVGEPLPALTTSGAHLALIEPFLVKYYGSGVSKTVTEPLDTVTARDRFGLVEGKWKDAALDIRFRMLQPHELSAAMGFPADYAFTGNRENRVKQIGNAVPVNTAAALCGTLI